MEDPRPTLEGIARNHVFTTGAAERVGVPRLELVALAAAREITHLARGVWSVAAPSSDEDLHVLRTVGQLRRMTSGTAAAAQSALLLHGLPLVQADLSTVQLARSEAACTRVGSGYAVRGVTEHLATTHRHPLLDLDEPVVTVESAIVGAGLLCAPVTALAAADAALAARLTTVERVEAAIKRVPAGAKGIAAVRAALALVDARRESPAESLTALVCFRLDHVLVPQAQIGPWRVDFLIEGTRVVIEVDGAQKYEDREVLLREKRREDDLRARGYVLVRLMWADLMRPEVVRAKIERALRLAA